VVYGPLSFDLATDPESVAIKGLPEHPNARAVAGRADILVCPGIDAANILYKTLAALSKYGMASLAGITVGFPVPYIILSRSDSLCIRLESIALCSIYFQRKKTEKRRLRSVRKPHSPMLVVFNPFPTKIEAALFDGEKKLQCREFALTPTETASAPSHLLRGTKTVKNIVRWVKTTGNVDAVAAPFWRKEEVIPVGEPGYANRGWHKRAVPISGKYFTGAPDLNAPFRYRQRAVFAACSLGQLLKIPAYAVFVGPRTTGPSKTEKISGYRSFIRTHTPHAPLIRLAVKKAEGIVGRPAREMNLVIALLGDTSAVASVKKGKITDSTGPLPESGPFSMPASGDLINVMKRIDSGDELARDVLDAMIFQHIKHIGAMYAACGSDVDAILLGGKLMESPYITNSLRHQLGRIAPVFVLRGSLELDLCAAEVTNLLMKGGGEKSPLRETVEKAHIFPKGGSNAES